MNPKNEYLRKLTEALKDVAKTGEMPVDGHPEVTRVYYQTQEGHPQLGLSKLYDKDGNEIKDLSLYTPQN